MVGRDALSNTSGECVVAKANEVDCGAQTPKWTCRHVRKEGYVFKELRLSLCLGFIYNVHALVYAYARVRIRVYYIDYRILKVFLVYIRDNRAIAMANEINDIEYRNIIISVIAILQYYNIAL